MTHSSGDGEQWSVLKAYRFEDESMDNFFAMQEEDNETEMISKSGP